jgi:hypothetical protein
MGDEPGEGRARPVGTWAGSFREAGRKLAGQFGDDSRTVRGLLGGGSAVRLGRRTPAMAPSRQIGGWETAAGPLREPLDFEEGARGRVGAR